MKFAIFRCCPTSVFLKQYETATDAVMQKLGVDLIDIPQFSCCGNPIKNYDFKAYLLSSARNLAIAEKRNLNIMTVCNCCFGSLKHAAHVMAEDASIRNEINGILKHEGLEFHQGVEVRHLLDVLHKDLGANRIQDKMVNTLDGVKIAVHYGCHILRPREITQFDDPENPTVFDELVEMTGAQSVDWKSKTTCCGAPVWGVNDDLSMDLTEKKIDDARKFGADYLCVVCVFCQLQFDRVQKMACTRRQKNDSLPSILYPQLLGLTLGINPETLGINQNELSISGILGFLMRKAASE